jgi:general stress protein 26
MNDIDAKSVERVWSAIEAIRVGMLVTAWGEGLRARPMHSIVRRDEYAIWFIAERHSQKLDEVAAQPDVLVAYSAGESGDQVALTGQIEIVDDRAKLEELWSPGASLYFPQGPSDPAAILLRFMPVTAEYWTGGRNPIVYAIKALQAKITGERPSIGEHGTVDMP